MSELDNNYQKDGFRIDIYDIIHDLLKDWWLIILMGCSVAMCAYIVVNITYKPVYTSSTTLVVTSKGSNNIYADLSAASTVANSLSKIFDSNIIKKKVVEDIGINISSDFIMAEVIPETNLFVLKVSSSSPNMAYRIIRSIMKNYTTVTNNVFDNAILDVLKAPEIPIYPDNILNSGAIMRMAFLIGMAAMLLLLAALSIMRESVKNEADVMRKLDTKLFGVIYHENKYKTLRSRIHRMKKRILITSPTVSFAFVENFKKMRVKLEFKASQNFHKVILITSVLENEGKSTVATNLALALAQKSNKVLLIDGDLSKPSVYKILQKEVQIDNEIGECILKKGELKGALTIDEDSGMFLAIGSKGYENTTDIIIRDSFADFISISKKVMDYIVIDSPPINSGADTEILADLADVTLLVVRQSAARTREINDAIKILSDCNAELLGCVYNNVRTSAFNRTSVYKYKYYKGYYRNVNKTTENIY